MVVLLLAAAAGRLMRETSDVQPREVSPVIRQISPSVTPNPVYNPSVVAGTLGPSITHIPKVAPVPDGLADEPQVEVRKSEAPTEERKAEVPPTEERKAEVPPTEERKAEVPPTEERKAEALANDVRKSSPPPAGKASPPDPAVAAPVTSDGFPVFRRPRQRRLPDFPRD
jgi:hypothetical protein